MRAFLLAVACAAAIAGGGDSARASGVGDGEAALTERLAGYVPGRPRSCVSARQLRESETFAGTAIVFETTGSRLYVNRPRGELNKLNKNVYPYMRSQSIGPCEGMIVDLRSRTDRTVAAGIILGEFVPYDRPFKRP